MLFITIELETSSMAAGPIGMVEATIRDGNGDALAVARSAEIGIGGKPPGPPLIKAFYSYATLSPEIAALTKTIDVIPECTGSVDRPWNVDLVNTGHAFSVVVDMLPGAR